MKKFEETSRNFGESKNFLSSVFCPLRFDMIWNVMRFDSIHNESFELWPHSKEEYSICCLFLILLSSVIVLFVNISTTKIHTNFVDIFQKRETNWIYCLVDWFLSLMTAARVKLGFSMCCSISIPKIESKNQSWNIYVFWVVRDILMIWTKTSRLKISKIVLYSPNEFCHFCFSTLLVMCMILIVYIVVHLICEVLCTKAYSAQYLYIHTFYVLNGHEQCFCSCVLISNTMWKYCK